MHRGGGGPRAVCGRGTPQSEPDCLGESLALTLQLAQPQPCRDLLSSCLSGGAQGPSTAPRKAHGDPLPLTDDVRLVLAVVILGATDLHLHEGAHDAPAVLGEVPGAQDLGQRGGGRSRQVRGVPWEPRTSSASPLQGPLVPPAPQVRHVWPRQRGLWLGQGQQRLGSAHLGKGSGATPTGLQARIQCRGPLGKSLPNILGHGGSLFCSGARHWMHPLLPAPALASLHISSRYFGQQRLFGTELRPLEGRPGLDWLIPHSFGGHGLALSHCNKGLSFRRQVSRGCARDGGKAVGVCVRARVHPWDRVRAAQLCGRDPIPLITSRDSLCHGPRAGSMVCPGGVAAALKDASVPRSHSLALPSVTPQAR